MKDQERWLRNNAENKLGFQSLSFEWRETLFPWITQFRNLQVVTLERRCNAREHVDTSVL